MDDESQLAILSLLGLIWSDFPSYTPGEFVGQRQDDRRPGPKSEPNTTTASCRF